MRLIIAVLALAACTDPSLNAGVSLSAGGLHVSPSVSGRVAGAHVSVRP